MNLMGPMERMQHQGGFAPNQPMGGGQQMMGPSPDIIQKLMQMFQGGMNPGGQMMPPQANMGINNGMPSMGGIGMSKPPMMGGGGMNMNQSPGFFNNEAKMRMGGFMDPGKFGGISGPNGPIKMGPMEAPEAHMGTEEKRRLGGGFKMPEVQY